MVLHNHHSPECVQQPHEVDKVYTLVELWVLELKRICYDKVTAVLPILFGGWGAGWVQRIEQ